jgi:hypothetical protein
MKQQHYDVVVVGGGASGVAAAIASAKNGAKTLIIDAGPMLGGELLSGLSIGGVFNALGEWIVGGVAKELFDAANALDGLIGPACDYRLAWYVFADPEIMKIVVMSLLQQYGVTPLLYSTVQEVVTDRGQVTGLIVGARGQKMMISAKQIVDCSGDADVAMMAGAPFELSNEKGELQPVSLMFRMSGVDTSALLRFLRENPENLGLGESDAIRSGRSDAELAQALQQQGEAIAFIKREGPLLGEAIRRGDMFSAPFVFAVPTSRPRREVCINATRVAENIDGTKADALSGTLAKLMEQVGIVIKFLRKDVPGFADAAFAGVAPRIGVRETRRIVGEYTLTAEDVIEGRKFETGVAKGSYHVDLHVPGDKQIRVPVKNGGSYDIPFGCLIPKGLTNVLAAGRCLSATRDAHASARVMGPCLGMGEAVGTAAALAASAGCRDIRDLPIQALRAKLKEQGAVLDGTH